jgi:hypothetical protein
MAGGTDPGISVRSAAILSHSPRVWDSSVCRPAICKDTVDAPSASAFITTRSDVVVWERDDSGECAKRTGLSRAFSD